MDLPQSLVEPDQVSWISAREGWHVYQSSPFAFVSSAATLCFNSRRIRLKPTTDATSSSNLGTILLCAYKKCDQRQMKSHRALPFSRGTNYSSMSYLLGRRDRVSAFMLRKSSSKLWVYCTRVGCSRHYPFLWPTLMHEVSYSHASIFLWEWIFVWTNLLSAPMNLEEYAPSAANDPSTPPWPGHQMARLPASTSDLLPPPWRTS